MLDNVVYDVQKVFTLGIPSDPISATVFVSISSVTTSVHPGVVVVTV